VTFSFGFALICDPPLQILECFFVHGRQLDQLLSTLLKITPSFGKFIGHEQIWAKSANLARFTFVRHNESSPLSNAVAS
jgi:hypothetical protein